MTGAYIKPPIFKMLDILVDPLNIIKIFNDKLVDEIIICDINKNKLVNLDIDYLKDIFKVVECQFAMLEVLTA